MVNGQKDSTWGYKVEQPQGGNLILRISGRMDITTASPMQQEFFTLLPRHDPYALLVDLKRVDRFDDYGALMLAELKKEMKRRESPFELINVPPQIAEFLSLIHFDSLYEPEDKERKQRAGGIILLGEAAIGHMAGFKAQLTFIGEVFLALLYVLGHPRVLRWDDTLGYMYKTGVAALPVVGLISFLLGLIMAFMSAVQLQQFGANIYVASLVSLSMTRELGPIMTAIVVAGRSGSAYAAEIGTMRISEEVDALSTMGFDPCLFLVIPKVLATLIVVPMLTVFSDCFAMAGGMLVGVGMLDLTVNGYITQTGDTLSLFDVFWGISKSVIFALLVSLIGCLRGFEVRGGGAAAVGQATTEAVVSSIFAIILCDSIFAVILRYWG